ncbi:beta-1,3-glucan-binding protein 1-like [Cylas formicarius]|uniref:beta-1,3-glucan-binding protein 1-like n=1 Tax=Cylas formicarius TaxID=197179 RepID=UPI002958B4E3|nr:beta-1,3-glucan-binding protein 1-like [Cylas formicarius]
MKRFVLSLTVCFVAIVEGRHVRSLYTVPEPKISVFDEGFRVSVPHENGIHLFAFHGKINEKMDGLEAGQFSKDILSRTGEQWVFEDRSTKLKIGDVIYYWLFIIRDGLGYRYDHGRFVVEEIVPYHPLEDTSLSSGTQTDSTKGTSCETLTLNLSEAIVNLTRELQKARELNRLLRDMAARDTLYSTRLKLYGALPEGDSPKNVVQRVVNEKLKSEVKIVDAVLNANKSITFQVGSLQDKIDLVVASRSLLKNSDIDVTY